MPIGPAMAHRGMKPKKNPLSRVGVAHVTPAPCTGCYESPPPLIIRVEKTSQAEETKYNIRAYSRTIVHFHQSSYHLQAE
jgi:hypothetical protein